MQSYQSIFFQLGYIEFTIRPLTSLFWLLQFACTNFTWIIFKGIMLLMKSHTIGYNIRYHFGIVSWEGSEISQFVWVGERVLWDVDGDWVTGNKIYKDKSSANIPPLGEQAGHLRCFQLFWNSHIIRHGLYRFIF